MRIWFDTEFIEDGRTIDLISIGLVREDGAQYYAENSDCDLTRASPWVKENVIPHLKQGEYGISKALIAKEVIKFAQSKPEFWAHCADYDWVVLCQLYGTMMQLPDTWPKFCLDTKQLAVMMGNPPPPNHAGKLHNALDDAIWCQRLWQNLMHRGMN